MEEKIYGWKGVILRIDLSSGTISKESSLPYVKDFIGGLGLGAKLMWDEIPPETQPFDPENRLIFATGPLTGTLAPTAGRMEVCSKAPAIIPHQCSRSGIGGRFGPELKFAGYDAIVVQGKAEKPVRVFIRDDSVEILDAGDLWGKDTYDTQKILLDTYGKQVQTICIGPAGEKLIAYSAVMNGTGHAAAKTGMGAVMGSKNLKAISVIGTGGVEIARPEEFIKECRKTRKMLLKHPVRQWASQGPVEPSVNFVNKYRTKQNGCFACPVGCRSWIEYPGYDPGEIMCLGNFYLWVGSDQESGWAAKVLTDRLGLCQYTVYDVIRWLRDCWKEGLFTEEETGIPWSEFGNMNFITKFVEKLLERNEFTAKIGDGARVAAYQMGDKAIELYKAYFPARNQSQHYSVRAFPEVLLQWATDSRDPLSDAHDWICLVYWAGEYWPRDQKGALNREQLVNCAIDAYGSENAADAFTYTDKAKTAIIVQHMSRLKNSLVLCDWSSFPINTSANTPDYKGDPDMERRLFNACVGMDVDKLEWIRYGERIFNVERAIMARDGRRRKDDTVEDYYFRVRETEVAAWEPEREEKPIAKPEEFEKMLTEYYTLRGADATTGLPGKARLDALKLGSIRAELEERGIL
jgi:aldehyde:ferredoxin oxidoreductase